MAKRPKFATNSAEVDASNGEITFIAARSVKNLNGWTYDVPSLQAQDATGEYLTLTNEAQEVSIPLMTNHSGDISNKIGNIDSAKIVSVDGVDHVEMHAKFFKGDEAQEVRQRILDGELTDVSITTDWGSGYSDEDDFDTLKNAHIIEVSVVYAGAEPKAKILASNSVDKKTENEAELSDEQLDTLAEKVAEKLKNENTETNDDTQDEDNQETEETEDNTEEKDNKSEEDNNNSEEEEEMATQPTNAPAEKVADKAQVLNALAKLAQNGAIRGMNRSQVIEAVRNEVTLTDADGDPYVVPDAVFTEILAVTKPTDILDTFDTIPVKRFTLMGEVPSEADLARAGRWSKGEQKDIQESDLKAQKFNTQFLYKLQEISYEDLQEDFGDLLLSYIRNELPQKVTEEEERDFIVGDGRATNTPRHISSIVSLDAAAEDNANVHVVKYDGSNDASDIAAITNGLTKIYVEGTTYAVMNKTDLTRLRNAGLSTASGLPFSEETIAGALGVERIFTREYVTAGTVYGYVGRYVKRLTGGNAGETIEQYDIDYNNRKIEYIRPVGGGASGLASAVKITLPGSISA